MTTSVTSFFLGRIPYKPAWRLQKSIVEFMKFTRNPSVNCILLLEHDPVYTIGVRQYDPANDYGEKEVMRLKSLGADFVKSDRGGLITYHGPGQLVAYPIIHLDCKSLQGKGIRWYVEALQQAGIQLCSQYGLVASEGDQTEIGVWLDDFKKIMALGIHRTDTITYHGVAFNCTMEPFYWFRQIVPCGLVHRDVTSLAKETNLSCNVKDIAPQLSNCIVSCLFKKSNLSYTYRNHLENSWNKLSSQFSINENNEESNDLALHNLAKTIIYELSLNIKDFPYDDFMKQINY